MGTTFCSNCKAKNDTSYYDQIKKLERLLQDVVPEAHKGNYQSHFFWNICPKCPYGMQCAEIRRNRIRAEKTARRLEDKMLAVAHGSDNTLYRQMLELTRGMFPAVYKSLEMERSKL